jgi:hypothetical protein
MADDNYIPQVDYTSRDYSSIREDLIELIPYYAPQWTNRDPADFGMTILELFAYIGDGLHYYIDRTANESFIETASQRESVLQIARLLGYTPTRTTPSEVLLTFQNSSNAVITVPKRTKVAANVTNNGVTSQTVFETDSAITVPAKSGGNNGSNTVTATQGETVEAETIGTSDGSANQVFELGELSVIKGSILIDVNGVIYTEVPYLVDYSGYDPVFSTYTNSDGTTFVQFGDSISGRIPLNGVSLEATYRVGGGTSGNIPANTIKFIKTNASNGLSVSNQDSGLISGAASGGADEESTDSIRINAPKSIRALNRAVSLSDYASLVIQVSGVAKAISVADVYSSVTVYFAPYGDSGLQSDGITTSVVFNNLKTEIDEYLVDKIPAGTTVTLQPPTYVQVTVAGGVIVLPTYRQDKVLEDVKAAVQNLFDFNNVVFNDYISYSDVLKAMDGVEGVSRANLQKLVRTASDQTFTVTNKVLSGGVATLTTSVNHNVTVGQFISVTGVDSTFNGVARVTAKGANTISYEALANNVSTAASTGSITVYEVNDIECAKSELPTLSSLTVTASGGITL